jgi:palmitoyl transferase
LSARAGSRYATLLALALLADGVHAEGCDSLGDNIFARGCNRLADTYRRGDNEIILSGYSYHIPGTWSPERRAQLNSEAWGFGLGRTTEDPDGDTHTVFFLGFKDSHSHLEAQIGYAYNTFWGPRDGVQVGLGYTAMIVQRPDIWNGVPFPVLLPLAALRYGNATLQATYVPTLSGSINHGSTLYVFGRVTLK